MCCIAVQPAGDTALPDEQLANMWDHNHDGSGYMFAVDGKLIVRKPFFKLAELRAAYVADHTQFGATSAFVLHFRWSTHGKKDETNTHPHILAGGRAALVHNGILQDFAPDWKSDVSDTVIFCARVLAYRQPSQLTSRKFGRYLGAMIGERNKFAIMDYKGNVSIVNESSGTWDGGRWYSNCDYQGRTVTLPPQAQTFCGYRDNSALPYHYQAALWQDEGAEDRRWQDKRAEEEKALNALESLFEDYQDRLIEAAMERHAKGEVVDWEAIDDRAWDLAEDELQADADAWELAQAAMMRDAS